MTLCLEKARRAWVRLPRPLHAALQELRQNHPAATEFGTSQFVRFEPRLSDWSLTTTVNLNNGIKNEPVRGETLNRMGLAFARHLKPLSDDRRSLAPLMPLADILADLPPGVLKWISGPPPIQKHAGGILFEALGVLIPTRQGDAYNPSRELILALDELSARQVVGPQDGPASLSRAPLLDARLTDALRMCLATGIPWRTSQYDGRLLRPIADTDGAGLLTVREEPAGVFWRVQHSMRDVAQALADGETDVFRLLVLCHRDYQEWVANGLALNLTPRHPRLLALLGIVKKRGKYDWRFTPEGADLQGRIAAYLNAADAGTGAVPDDAHYEGAGVDIALPDADLVLDSAELPAANPWDILGEMTGTVPPADLRAIAEEPGFAIQPVTPGADDTLTALDSLIATTADAQRSVEEPGFHVSLPADTPPDAIAEAFAQLLDKRGVEFLTQAQPSQDDAFDIL